MLFGYCWILQSTHCTRDYLWKLSSLQIKEREKERGRRGESVHNERFVLNGKYHV